ncbi:MAG: hypothetical protein NTY77_11695 [Elusimicrobia bacterium]|nr:hypothetical protein [Elusimicrobiota bacterium]
MRTVSMCLAALLSAGAASAQQPQPQDQTAIQQVPAAPKSEKSNLRSGPCKPDVERFCKDAEQGLIGECLKKHEAALSDACQAGIQEHAQKNVTAAREQAKDACKADAARFCKGVEKSKVGDCLQKHNDELFVDCRASRKKMRRMRDKHEEKTEAQKPVRK